MKAILKWPGGKSRELNVIKSFVPEYTGRYIEPFCGGGALFFDLEKENCIINDINDKLMRFYMEIKEDIMFPKIMNELNEVQKVYQTKSDTDKADMYYKYRDIFNKKAPLDCHYATVFYVINKLAYGGLMRYNKSGEFNVPFGWYKSFNPHIITEEHHKLLQRTQIYCKSYNDIFNLSEEDDFIFIDPPYDCTFTNYGNAQDFLEEEQRELCQDFKNLSCKAMTVINDSPLIRELYSKYIVCEYNKKYSVNIKNRIQNDAKHVIITNFK